MCFEKKKSNKIYFIYQNKRTLTLNVSLLGRHCEGIETTVLSGNFICPFPSQILNFFLNRKIIKIE